MEHTKIEAADDTKKPVSEKELTKRWEKRDVDIEHVGSKITLPDEPDPMPLRVAIKALERKAKDEETEMSVFEIIDAYPYDALVALNMAMKERYGWASAQAKKTWFGEIPPTMLTIKTGPKATDNVQVPHGVFSLPGVENPIETHFHHLDDGRPCLVITGTVRKREFHVIRDLAILAREILKTDSIYRGQAIRLRVDEDGDLNQQVPPEFIDTDAINPDELVLNEAEWDNVRAALWAPIENTAECVKHKIPLNRGILLEGPYGTGKTLTAAATSVVCVRNAWTYILLDDVRALKEALLFAQRYAPAVVFAEDVDRVADKRDQAGNDLLNTIDGVLTKNSRVITVLTTNHVEKLDKAMLRPGRLDAVISVQPPEPKAVERLIHMYGRDLIDPKEDLTEVGKVLAGNIPATIREVVERSKLAMIANGHKKVTGKDLVTAAVGMEYHLKLLRGVPDAPTKEHVLGAALVDLVRTNVVDPALTEQGGGDPKLIARAAEKVDARF